MKRMSLLTLLLCALAPRFSAFSDQPMMMWRIGKDGHAAHLVGSIHMGTSSLYPLPAPMTDALLESTEVLFEVNPAELNQDFNSRLYKVGRLPAGENLRDLLDPAMRKQYEATLKRIQAPINSADECKPWLAALMITFSANMRSMDALSINHGIDRYFTGMAKQLGKPVRGLETAEDQLNLLASLDGSVGLEFLGKTLDEVDNLESIINRMVTAWKTGDTAALEKVVDESFADYPDMRRSWLADRNRAWSATIADLLARDGKPFIVVGAAHCVGPDSLPELLRTAGFNVEQAALPDPAAAP